MKSQGEKTFQIAIWLAAAVTLGFWLIMFFWGAPGKKYQGRYLLSDASLRTTQGRIVISEPGGGKRGYSYKIRYRYFVNQIPYYSEVLDYGPRSGSWEYMSYYLEKYSTGKEVMVFYSEDDHSFAILDPHKYKDDGNDFFFLITPIFSLLLMLYPAIANLKRKV
jgi:hypothetical protein